jgi:hypothetical protein
LSGKGSQASLTSIINKTTHTDASRVSNPLINHQYCFHKQQQPPVFGVELDPQVTTAMEMNSYKVISQQ